MGTRTKNRSSGHVSVSKNLKQSFTKADTELYLCPSCQKGQLVLDVESVREEETASSQTQHSHDDWDPDWYAGRFVATLKCNWRGCGEFVAVAGSTSLEPEYSEDDEGHRLTNYQERYRPEFISPAPRLFELPRKCPGELARELDRAFAAFWYDANACANSLRCAVEQYMTIEDVARLKRDRRPRPLHERIVEWSQRRGCQVLGNHLLAIKWIGNPGSHAGDLPLTRNDLFDALDFLRHVLIMRMELGPQEEKLVRRAKMINRKKKPLSHQAQR